MGYIYVYAWFDPRTMELHYQDYTKPPVIEHFDEVKYSGSTFGVWEKGTSFRDTVLKAYARLTRYFANRSQEYANKAISFANYAKFCALA